MTILSTVLQRSIETILPARCVGCGSGGAYLCDACLPTMERPTPQVLVSDAFVCDSIGSVFVYGDIARTAVHRLKFNHLRALGPEMARQMLACVPAEIDLVLPVPLHGSRLRERGYNQAGLLAAEIASSFGLPLGDRSLSRVRKGAPQVGASAAGRQANVRDAFVAGDDVSGRRVLLIDDVMTTGATLNAAADVLKSAGALSVHALTFAREV